MEHGARVVEETYAGMNVLAVADKDVVEYLEELEQSMEKRKTTSPQAVGMVPNSSILQVCVAISRRAGSITGCGINICIAVRVVCFVVHLERLYVIDGCQAVYLI